MYFSRLCDDPQPYVAKFTYIYLLAFFTLYFLNSFLVAFILATIIALLSIVFIFISTSMQQKNLFEAELPFVIKLLKDSISSGLSLFQALHIIMKDIKGPVRKIFSSILYKKKLGMSYHSILTFELENTQNLEFSLFCSAISINEETGGKLNKVMGRLEYILTSRKKLRQEMAIAIAESKANGYMVMSIYIGLSVFLASTQKNFISFFMYDDIGKKLGLTVLGLFIFSLSIINLTAYYIKHRS